MPNPQQPELRRSGFVPALDPDATESRLSGEERPSNKSSIGGVPEDQQPGHHPDTEQDKPDLDDFAARLGIVPEGEEPDDAPRVEDPAYVPSADDRGDEEATDDQGGGEVHAGSSASSPTTAPKAKHELSPIGLALVGPLTAVKIAQGILRAVTRRRG